MDELMQELNKPVWWFSVVIAGIAINILSSYMRNVLDTYLSDTMSWWRRRSKSRQASWRKRIDFLVSGAEARSHWRIQMVMWRLRSLTFMLLSMFFFGTGGLTFLVNQRIPTWFIACAFFGATFAFFMSYICINYSERFRREIYQAMKELGNNSIP